MRDASLKTFCDGLKKQNHFLLSSHVSPEGDAVGSLLAIDSLLRRIGKKTTIVNEDVFPERLYCLPHKERWNSLAEIKGKSNRFDALVVTDCPTLERIGRVKELMGPQTVIFNIDHHISNVRFGQYNFVRPEAAASGEVVYDIFKHFKFPLTKEEATSIYVALSTDTGSFKYSNTGIHAHLIAAELIKTGIDVDKINEELYATYSLNKIQLYSRLLGKVQTASGGKIAWVAMKREDLKECNATYEDTEGFIDFLKYLKEVKVAFFLSEMGNPSEVKVSFRSKGSYDVNQIATAFGGGGHKKASGCTIPLSSDEAVEAVLKEIRRQFRFK
ncbi:MAG: bifunctional oligoribonuclease/PAP phosphatase NrnA [Candidatus Omnitrophica bacterium]|nr:bifunctional oligoribonuclease/PAP phosphatase NrnA [Candidatus Omnitrophota bacterium]